MFRAAYENIYRHMREDLYSGFLGVGAFVLPLVATYFSYKRHWSYHFAHHPIGIAVSNSVFLVLVFELVPSIIKNGVSVSTFVFVS